MWIPGVISSSHYGDTGPSFVTGVFFSGLVYTAIRHLLAGIFFGAWKTRKAINLLLATVWTKTNFLLAMRCAPSRSNRFRHWIGWDEKRNEASLTAQLSNCSSIWSWGTVDPQPWLLHVPADVAWMRTGKLQWFLWFLMIRMSVAQQLSLFTLGFEEMYGGLIIWHSI